MYSISWIFLFTSALNRSKNSESIIGEIFDSIIDLKSIESILKNAESILKIRQTIADVGTKSANRGSTSVHPILIPGL